MPNDVNGKLDTLILAVEENSTKLDTIEQSLVGDMKTGKVGLLELVRQVERWIEKREWFEKVIIAAVVANFIAIIFVLIQSSLK